MGKDANLQRAFALWAIIRLENDTWCYQTKAIETGLQTGKTGRTIKRWLAAGEGIFQLVRGLIDDVDRPIVRQLVAELPLDLVEAEPLCLVEGLIEPMPFQFSMHGHQPAGLCTRGISHKLVHEREYPASSPEALGNRPSYAWPQ